jgi:hypothetical protein
VRGISPTDGGDRLGGSESGAVILIGRYRRPGRDDPPRGGSVVADTYFCPFIYGHFLNRFYSFEGRVAAEVKTGPPGALALGSVADQPCPAARGLLDWLFADPTTGSEETRMATGTTKCFTSIARRRRQFRAALRIPAAMPQSLALGELQIGLRSGERYFMGLIQHDALSSLCATLGGVGLVNRQN